MLLCLWKNSDPERSDSVFIKESETRYTRQSAHAVQICRAQTVLEILSREQETPAAKTGKGRTGTGET